MKIRNGFVSNSSSSSFCLYGYSIYDIREFLEKIKNYIDNDKYKEIVCGIDDIDDIDDVESISVYPNPSDGIINLALEGVKSQRATVTVMNTSGTKVYEKQIEVRGERVDHQIDINDQPEGVYLVKTKVNNESITRKVVVR